MANLTPQAVWEEIYSIAEDDPVQGGEGGIDNIPHQQLANRTEFVKQQVDKLRGALPDDEVADMASLLSRIKALESAGNGQGQPADVNLYPINTVGVNYTLTAEDITSGAILRVDSPNAVTITVPVLNATVGQSVTVRRVTGAVTIVGNGTMILPADSSALRRAGSTATLIYVGNNVWDIYTELGA